MIKYERHLRSLERIVISHNDGIESQTNRKIEVYLKIHHGTLLASE